MVITDRDGNFISGNYFSITTEDTDVDMFYKDKIDLDHNVSSTIIAVAISQFIDREFNDTGVVYKEDK